MSKEKAAKMAGQWWADRLQQGDKEKFAKEIEWRILYALEEEGTIYLVCDYDPHGILLDALHAIGMECRGYMFSAKGILPEKHELMVTENYLAPKEGYGNWTEKILVV